MHWFCTWTNSTHVQTVDTRPFFLTFQAKHTSQYTQTHLWSSIIEQASWSSSIVTWDTLTVMRIPRYIISLNHTHTTVVHSGFIATPTHNKLVASLLIRSWKTNIWHCLSLLSWWWMWWYCLCIPWLTDWWGILNQPRWSVLKIPHIYYR